MGQFGEELKVEEGMSFRRIKWGKNRELRG